MLQQDDQLAVLRTQAVRPFTRAVLAPSGGSVIPPSEALPANVAFESDESSTGSAATRRWRGVFTALVTPFAVDGSIDSRALRSYVAWQILAGVDGVVPCGSTGEPAALTPAERLAIVALTVETANERLLGRSVTVLAGIGNDGTSAAVAATRRVANVGADAALVSPPHLNRPSQRALERHYRTIADEGGLPIVICGPASRNGTNLAAETLLRLAEHPVIVGVKVASANPEQTGTVLRDRPPGFAVMSGDDASALTVLRLGAEGMISVASNEAPGALVQLYAAARAGDWDEARGINERWAALFAANSIAPNPVPVKAAMRLMGLLDDRVRAPLEPLTDQQRGELTTILVRLGLVARPGGRA